MSGLGHEPSVRAEFSNFRFIAGSRPYGYPGTRDLAAAFSLLLRGVAACPRRD